MIKSPLAAFGLAFSLVTVGISGVALAAGTETVEPAPAAADYYAAGKAAVDAKDYRTAIRHLTAAVEADPNSADAENLLGFSNRKLGNYDEARKHYWRALELDPDHRGAHEYLGEAFLELKQLEKAEGRLVELRRVCPTGCEELDELKAAIDAYKAANPG
ncbi:tetratricopeptide repeat protein [Zavarzinia compransoris]|uniref:tetratricopeptide repeat protein n=1 Tax=Zavarzinia marina TaxID=2911065 RepID=UPI001F26E374|nr:tetratricopeptide repeat protein [Zavarzinia marina]MCF4164998.1 tetratricopeptide repeat protein [Zavarzinia marina]